jgi:hypothetical protein
VKHDGVEVLQGTCRSIGHSQPGLPDGII